MSARAVGRIAAVTVAWVGCGGMLALCVVHAVLGDGVMVGVWLHATMAYLPLAVLPFLGLALVLREWGPAAPGALTLGLWAVFNRPPLPPAPLPDDGIRIRIASANALMVNPTPAAFVAEILAQDPDVVLFQEFTPDIQAAMQGSSLVHSREHPEWHSFGVGLYSRHPIVSESLTEIGGVDWQRAVLDVGGRPLEVWNVHTLPPFRIVNHEAWQLQVATLAAKAARVEGPLVVAGDFNLTRHHQGYRSLTGPLTDAYRDCGRWKASTWPANGVFGAWVPLIRLDHVFLGGGVRCASIAEGTGPGSDHRPIFAELVLPR